METACEACLRFISTIISWLEMNVAAADLYQTLRVIDQQDFWNQNWARLLFCATPYLFPLIYDCSVQTISKSLSQSGVCQ